MISSNVDKYNFNILFRNEDNEYYQNLNAKRSKDSYDYWRSHLCLDFAYSMTKCLEMTNTPLIMWLEDDTIVDIEMFNELDKLQNITAVSAYKYCGFPCIIFERNYLSKYIELIYKHYMEDIPLDWYIHRFNLNSINFNSKYAHHIGEVSTRNVIRVVD